MWTDIRYTDGKIADAGEQQALAMLKTIDPLFREQQCYVICKTAENKKELPSDNANARGWAGTNLANQCRRYLESRGQWRGDGNCMIINMRFYSPTDSAFLATCVHEAAHWLEWRVTTAESHGPVFRRAATHAASRAALWAEWHGISFDVHDVLSNSTFEHRERYPQSLGREIHQVDKPICWHLRQPEPAAFAALCRGFEFRLSTPRVSPQPSAPRKRNHNWTGFIGGQLVQVADGVTTTY